MENMINIKLLKKVRNDKHWSQDELAIASGLSLRTVQRVESSGKCSQETLKSLCAALDVDVNKLESRAHLLTTDYIFSFLNRPKKAIWFLFIPLVIALIVFMARNYQSEIEFNFIIEDEYGIFTETLFVSPNQAKTNVFKLHNGYSLEIDYIYGITPRLKSQLFFTNEGRKILLHTSNRIGTEFLPVQYKVTPSNIRFISPFVENQST
ncbi:helix-turn-helix transcriptional regulator [Catenovulum sp. 2E275]|uniref:helix-turn-helix domain-containing protein n=1 Tax=Catenovulum sp. 2E275 TaxID=2980497 RepID=UPI0021D1DB6A|nr:helix-turn-helix transcriptional regulator [Catenovulum sp. 2E275]MCU4677651.1 helix-turn-helix transcriptional regulator [Catenovulum sp. 2E275]